MKPAALISSAESLALPPASDPVRGDALAALRARLVSGERAVEAARYDDAVSILEELRLVAGQPPHLALRGLLAESWARLYRGELDEALELLNQATVVAGRPGFSDLDRAEVLFRIGCVRVKRGANARAIGDLTLALELCASSGLPSERLRAEILQWRSRPYQSLRDFEAARADVEEALELIEATDHTRVAAHVNFRASVLTERGGDWLLARFYAEKARDLYEEIGDRANVGRLLNNLGGLHFLLGRPDAAIVSLKQAIAIGLDDGNDVDAAYAISSLAQVLLRTGEAARAEPQARHALRLLGDREDVLDEIGNVQLVLGRSLLDQERHSEAGWWFASAERSFARLESPSLLAAAWIAQGDLARAQDDVDAAADLYLRAAQALQDFHF
jgi:tetratricopeptide (TPR) repeat protein